MTPIATDGSGTTSTTSKPLNFWNIVWSLLWVMLIVLVILKIFFFEQVNVIGGSMEPNYYTDQMLVVDEKRQTLTRGQVVAVYEDKNIAKNANYFTRFQPTTRLFLKRVIGLPGEEIEMVGSKVIIYSTQYPDGAVLPEDYISSTVKSQQEALKYYFPRTKIDDNSYFLLGDNRTNSTDSRVKGAFPKYSIFGQEVFRYWPVGQAGLFQLPNYALTPLSDELKQQIIEYKNHSQFALVPA